MSDLPGSPGEPVRCGQVTIVGRPNVGKSTLMNALLGVKLSITSRKAQTTRHRIQGVRTRGATQFVFVDTPGLQQKHVAGRTALNRTLNRTAEASMAGVDAVLFVVEAGRWRDGDDRVLQLLPTHAPVLLVANKLDQVVPRESLLPWLAQLAARCAFDEIVPMSAQSAADVERLLGIVEPKLPLQPWLFDGDALTNRPMRFLAAEAIREKLFRLTGDELPYGATVVIDRFEEPAAAAEVVRIAATIVVQRDAHKGMVIGAGGERLKRIGSEARQDIEALLGRRVFLELWVKVRTGWADDEAHLRAYGYE